MLDRHLMLRVKWTIVDEIHPKDNKFVMSVKIKATVDSKLSESPVPFQEQPVQYRSCIITKQVTMGKPFPIIEQSE